MLNVVSSFKIYFSFPFWSDFNLESTVKQKTKKTHTYKIRGLKQLFTPFSPNWKIFFP